MAQGDMVTLVGPNGDTYTTDQPAEVTTLVTSHGYRRASGEDLPKVTAEPSFSSSTGVRTSAPAEAADLTSVSDMDDDDD